MERPSYNSFLITADESKLLKELSKQFKSGGFKSELHYMTAVCELLGIDPESYLLTPLGYALNGLVAYRIFVYPDMPFENCVVSKGIVLGILKRRKV